MDWYDIEDTILEKPKEEVDKLVCPECGGKFEITYGMESGSLSIRCLGCGILSRNHGFPIPFMYKDLSAQSSFDCCSQFEQCSDAKRCVHENRLYSTACSYRRNLEAGRIFYGKNRNTD